MSVRVRALLGALALVVAVAGIAWVATRTGPLRSAPIQTFQRTGDERKIVANVVVGTGDELVGSSAVEDGTSVTVTVHMRPWPGPGFRTLVGIGLPIVVPLRQPLGDRVVRDHTGSVVPEAGIWQIPREPPVDLAEVGQVEKGSFRMAGETVDFRWKDFTGKARSLADFRGLTVVVLSRTSFSNDSKVSFLAVQEYLRTATPEERSKVVFVLVTLAEDPVRAMVLRPSASTFPLLTTSEMSGADAPEIFRLSAAPVLWFVGPDGTVRHRSVGVAASRDDVVRGVAAAR